MMDGRVSAIRNALDKENLIDTPIMSYAAKICIKLFMGLSGMQRVNAEIWRQAHISDGPSECKGGNQEVSLDIEEGADIVMVKPALSYLDIIYRVKQEFNLPVLCI